MKLIKVLSQLRKGELTFELTRMACATKITRPGKKPRSKQTALVHKQASKETKTNYPIPKMKARSSLGKNLSSKLCESVSMLLHKIFCLEIFITLSQQNLSGSFCKICVFLKVETLRFSVHYIP